MRVHQGHVFHHPVSADSHISHVNKSWIQFPLPCCLPCSLGTEEPCPTSPVFPGGTSQAELHVRKHWLIEWGVRTGLIQSNSNKKKSWTMLKEKKCCLLPRGLREATSVPVRTQTVFLTYFFIPVFLGFPCGSAGKESACDSGDLGLTPGLGRAPGEGIGYPLQYSGLEKSMDCILHGVAKSQTRLNKFHFTGKR